MDFLEDYWKYHSCYEIPRNYALWSGVSLISAVMHRKLYYCIGNIEVHATDYVLLVGPQGNKKTTCCDFASGLFRKVCPDAHVGASTQSAEDIVKNMCEADFVRTFTNEKDEMVEVRGYAFFINEFKDFIAYAPVRMLNFLGNMYDRKFFDASTIKRGAETIINPSINILACENPDQLIKFMKNDIMTGGFSRRIIIVYEPDYAEPRAVPFITPEAAEAWARVEQRLIDTRAHKGQYKFTPEGQSLFTAWYNDTHKEMAKTANPMMKGYLSTKNVHLLKTCMSLDSVSDKPMFLFTPDLLEVVISLTNVIEPNMPKLSASAGRNELAASQQKLIEMLQSAPDHMLSEKQLMRQIQTELTPAEIFSVFRHLENTDQMVKRLVKLPNPQGTVVERWMVMTPERWRKGLKDGDWKEK